MYVVKKTFKRFRKFSSLWVERRVYMMFVMFIYRIWFQFKCLGVKRMNCPYLENFIIYNTSLPKMPNEVSLGIV